MNPEHASRRRKEIVGAARGVFAKRGFHAAQIADIAGAMGIGHGTIYRYFKDKRELFGAVLEDVVAQVADAALAYDAPLADTLAEYRAQVDRIGQRLFELLLANEDLFRIIFEEAPAVDREIAEQVARGHEAFAAVTESYLVNGQKKGFLRKDVDARAASFLLNALVFEGARVILRAKDRMAAHLTWRATVSAVFFDGIGTNKKG